MSALSNRERLSDEEQNINLLGRILKPEFFAVIKQNCGKSVAKYWLTGVLPAFRDGFSPLTATRVISFDKRYQSLCGFTQEDVNAIVTRALPESERASTLNSLKRWYNGYMFSPTLSGSENSTLYNPQLLFVHLESTVCGQKPSSYVDEATDTVLSLVGETGPITIHDLIRMLSSKVNASIMSELSFIELMQEQEKRSKNVTWSLLHYLGIVTFCEDSDNQEEGTHSLSAPNGTMTHLIRERIRNYLKGDPGFFTRMRNSYKGFMCGNPTSFVELLEDFDAIKERITHD
jgi:hypothetical protein